MIFIRKRASVVFLFCFCLITDPVAGQSKFQDSPQSVLDVLDSSISAVDQLSALQFEFEELFPDDFDPAMCQLAEKNESGRPVHAFVKLCWDYRKLYHIEVREWHPPDVRHLLGGSVYDHYVFTIDGEFYRGANDCTKSAMIRPEKYSSLGYTTPLLLLGHHVPGTETHLCRHLREHASEDFALSEAPDGTVKITGAYSPLDGSYARTFELSIDPKLDYLPVHIVTRFKWTNTLDQEIRVTRTEIISGIRIPVAGYIAGYSINEILPNGLTNGDINAMPKEEYFRDVEPYVIREAKLLSEVNVDFPVNKIVVNEIHPLSFFRLEIPDDYDTVDFSTSTIQPVDPERRKQKERDRPLQSNQSRQIQEQTLSAASISDRRDHRALSLWLALLAVNTLFIVLRIGYRTIKRRDLSGT